MYVKRIALAAAVLCGCATIAVRERSMRSPSALLNNGVSADGLPILSKGLDYIPLHDAGAMGTNRAFLSHADGEGTGQHGPAGFGTNAAFLNKGDGAGQSTKALRTQKLYAWDASMEGTYLPADPAYAGGTVANAFGNGWANSASTANNLGGIRGTTPANVLPLQSGWVAGPTAVGRRVQLQQRWVRNQMLAAAAPGLDMWAMGTNSGFLHEADGQNTGFSGSAGMGTNAVFANLGDGKGTGMTGRAGFGTNSVFQGKESFKSPRAQQLYAWDASMEGTYLPADPAYAGGTVANAFGNGWANSASTANNLGGIRGTTPANVLPLQSGWVAGPTR